MIIMGEHAEKNLTWRIMDLSWHCWCFCFVFATQQEDNRTRCSQCRGWGESGGGGQCHLWESWLKAQHWVITVLHTFLIIIACMFLSCNLWEIAFLVLHVNNNVSKSVACNLDPRPLRPLSLVKNQGHFRICVTHFLILLIPKKSSQCIWMNKDHCSKLICFFGLLSLLVEKWQWLKLLQMKSVRFLCKSLHYWLYSMIVSCFYNLKPKFY